MDVAPTLDLVPTQKGTPLFGAQQTNTSLTVDTLGVALAELAHAHCEVCGQARDVLMGEDQRARTPAAVGTTFHALKAPFGGPLTHDRGPPD